MKVKKRYIAIIVAIACVASVVVAYRAFQHAWVWGDAEPIHMAAHDGNLEALRRLLQDGADLEPRASAYARQWFDVTPMHIAAEQDQVGSIELLASSGAGVDTPDSLGRSPLWAAVWHCSESAATKLLALGADPNGVAADDEWAGDSRPFQRALLHCPVSITTEFLRHGSPLELGGESALSWVEGPDRLEKLELLIPHGLSVDARNERTKSTALGNAAAAGDVDAVGLLIDHGADIDLPSDSYGLTPVFWAAYGGNDEVLEYLLDAGANPHTGTESFGTLVYAAAFNGHAETVRTILGRDLGIDLHVGRASDGATPLHMAYWNGNNELVKLLLDAGADPEICTSDGRTPAYR